MQETEPLGDLSKFEGDKNPVESGEKFTVEEWKVLAKDWHPVFKLVARFAAKRTYEERRARAMDLNLTMLFNQIEDKDLGQLVADIWSLSDEALQKLNTAINQNDRRSGKNKKT